MNKHDGRLIWKFKTEDSLKAPPTIIGNRVIVSGLDHYVYFLNAKDGSLIWKFKSGFEVDCSAAVIDGRVGIKNWRKHQRYSGHFGRSHLYRRL